MSPEIPRVNDRCPYVVEPDTGEGSRAGRRAHYKCGIDEVPQSIAPHRQESFCLCSRYVMCPDYPVNPVDDEDEEDTRAPASPKGLEATLAETGIVLLMAGMIAFAVFAIAPRPEETLNSRGLLAAQTQVLASDPRTTPAPTGAVPVSTAVPAATALPVPSTPAPTRGPSSTRAPVPTPTRASGSTYVVRPGDTLYSIARSLGVTVDALSRANGLADPKMLRTGQTLRIP